MHRNSAEFEGLALFERLNRGLDSVKDVLRIGYFLILLFGGFSDIGICFFVGLGNRVVEKLVVFLFGYFIKIGCLISQCERFP